MIANYGESYMNDLNLEIKGFGKINEANIELNKINVVGGINSSGKSTVSRLLYCYLKADVLNNEEYIRNVLMGKLKDILDDQTLLPAFGLISLSNTIEKYVHDHNQKDDLYLLIKLLVQDKQISYTSILRDLINKEHLDSFKGYSKLFNSCFVSVLGNEFDKNQYDEGFVQVRSKMRGSKNAGELNDRLNELMDSDDDYFNDYNDYDTNLPFDDYEDDFEMEMEYDAAYGYKLYIYKTKGYLNLFNDVFYIDSLSILDMLDFFNSEKNDANSIDVIYPKNHIKYLIDSLSDKSYLDALEIYDIETLLALDKEDLEYYEGLDKRIVDIIKKIYKIINGSVYSGKNDVYYSFDDYVVGSVGTGNIASGIKQIGIIELLVSNGKLKDNSFLIIDEPEVNLHPYWQYKFAEILVMLAKEVGVTIYINSHSPMFIEAIDAFSEFYDMQKDINYYLTEKSENGDKYNFIKINQDELFKIYNVLGRPYDLIDQLRLRKQLGE